MLKSIPEFRTEDEERAFWAQHDSTEYLDWKGAERVIFPKLKPATKTISLRMSESMLNELKLLANKMDVPYQSLIKVYLREQIDKDLHREAAERRERVDIIPDDLESALRKVAGALSAYRSLPTSRKKQYIYWLQSAKRGETKQKRIQKIVEEVLGR
jgi:predicted DNA binding CopG/RHH family protein